MKKNLINSILIVQKQVPFWKNMATKEELELLNLKQLQVLFYVIRLEREKAA